MTATLDVAPAVTDTVAARGLTKHYGDVVALAGVDLVARRGEILGILGPNGAGKSTLLEILCGLRASDAGSVRVLGLDPARDRRELAFRIGVQTQEFGLPAAVRTREALELFARLYPRSLDPDALLAQVDLTEKARTRFDQLSGGQKRRLSLAKALVGDPDLLVLDEPTTALDPQGRDFLRQRIRALGQEGRTVILSTHDIADAELVCDRIVVLDHGRVLTSGTASELVARHAASHTLRFRADVRLPEGCTAETTSDGSVLVHTDDPHAMLGQLDDGDATALLDLRATSLEDVFLLLTGRNLRT